MSDIVERLRAKSGEYDSYGWYSDIVLEAADEIERLRAREAKLREALEKIARHDMQAVAMDALQPGERIRPPAPGVSSD